MEAKIMLVGELDLDLTKRGVKAGEIHTAYIKENGVAEFYDTRIDHKYPAVVYPDNYFIVDD